MKILIALPCLLTGGTEIQTLSLVKALVGAGHQVRTVCYFEHSPLMVANYRQAGSEVALLSPDGSRCPSMRQTIALLWRGLRREVRDFRPDVAHVQYMAPGAVPIFVLRALGVRRILATAHTGADIYSPRGLQLVRWLARNVLSGFQCITLAAERSFFGESGGLLPADAGKVRLGRGSHFTIYNCLPDYIELRESPREFGDELTVGVVSRLEHIKGMDLVLADDWLRRMPQLRLLVVGDGSQRELMERQAREMGVSDRVEFVGRQPQAALQGYYDRIDVLLMPSRSEGFGLTAVEGMARGCVPVVAAVGGLPEVVRHAASGVVVSATCAMTGHGGGRDGGLCDGLCDGHGGGHVDGHDESTCDGHGDGHGGGGFAAALGVAIEELVGDRARLGALSAGAMRRAGDFSGERYAEGVAAMLSF